MNRAVTAEGIQVILMLFYALW